MATCKDAMNKLRRDGILIKLSKEDLKRIEERKEKRKSDIRTRKTYGQEGRRYYENNNKN